MGRKLFDKVASTEEYAMTAPALSMEDIVEADMAKAQFDEDIEASMLSIENHIEILDAIIALEESIGLDAMPERDVQASLEEFIIIANNIGYPSKLLSDLKTQASVEDFDGNYKVSLEAILEEKKGMMASLQKLGRHFMAEITEEGKQLASLFPRFSKYNIAKLSELKKQVEEGKLVPKKSLDESAQKKLNEKFGVFHAFGNSLNNVSDIINYLEYPIKHINNGFYDKTLKWVYKDMFNFAKGENSKIQKDKESSDFIAGLKNVKFAIDPKSEEFKTGMLISMFGSTVSMSSIVHKDGKSPTTESDVFKVTVKEDIKPLPKADAIKLLDWGIKSEGDISKAISATKGRIIKEYGKPILDAILADAGLLASVFIGLHKFGSKNADNKLSDAAQKTIAKGPDSVSISKALIPGEKFKGSSALTVTNGKSSFSEIISKIFNAGNKEKALSMFKTGFQIAAVAHYISTAIRLLFGTSKYITNVLKHLVILNKEMVNYDKVIIEYIMATYEKAEK